MYGRYVVSFSSSLSLILYFFIFYILFYLSPPPFNIRRVEGVETDSSLDCLPDHASTPEHASGCSNRHRTRCRGQVYTYLQFENPAIFESEKDSTRTDSTPTAAYLITQASWRCVDFRYKGFYLCVFFFAIWLGF